MSWEARTTGGTGSSQSSSVLFSWCMKMLDWSIKAYQSDVRNVPLPINHCILVGVLEKNKLCRDGIDKPSEQSARKRASHDDLQEALLPIGREAWTVAHQCYRISKGCEYGSPYWAMEIWLKHRTATVILNSCRIGDVGVKGGHRSRCQVMQRSAIPKYSQEKHIENRFEKAWNNS